MTEPQIGTGLADIKVEVSGSELPAPVEQKSPEMVTTEPALETPEPVSADLPPESTKPESSADDKANATARQALEDRIRADNAERQLKELQPKSKIPETKPDINDKATWGEKYKDSPNDLDTFLQARDEWAEAQGEKRARDSINQAEQQRQEIAIKTEVARKEQDSRKKHPDYDATINPIVPIIRSSPILKDFIAKNPMGTEVAYELGKNPAVLQKLMQGDMWAAGEQLINMAARLKAPRPVEITKAPEPLKPVGSRETVRPNLAEMSAKDVNGYIATRNKQELARRRAN